MHDREPVGKAGAFLAEAESMLSRGKPEAAAVLLDKAAGFAPNHPAVRRLRGMVFAASGRYAEALALLNPLLTAPSLDWPVAGAMYRSLRGLGKRAQARLFLSGIVDVYPDATEARELLAAPFNHYLEFYHAHEAQGLDISELAPRVPEGSTPYFSIITPSYNQAVFLEDTIRAAMWQGFPSYEHIVFDGGSTDGSVDILRKYPHLQWVSEPDSGQTHALNKGFARARGEVVAWINSDDFHPPQAFQAVADFFARYPEERVVMGDCMWVFEQNGRFFLHSNREKSFEDIIRYWSDYFHPSQQALFFKRELLDEVGLLDESLDFTMDWDFFLRLTLSQPIRYLPALLGVYRFHGESKSGSGEDWSDFYPDQQRVYPRFKHYSRRLPQKTLVSAVFPCFAHLMADPGHVTGLRAVMEGLARDIMRDMEFLLVGDEELSSELMDTLDIAIPVRFAHAPEPSRDGLLQAVHDTARGVAFCFPPLDAPPPERWLTGSVDILLDLPYQTRVPLPRSEGASHPLLGDFNSGEEWNCQTLYRRERLARVGDGWTSLSLSPESYGEGLEMISQSPKLSVVVATCNRKETLLKNLRALSRQTLPPDRFEVLVCDDGSMDGTGQALEAFDAPFALRHLRNAERKGPASARNLGIREAGGDVVVFLNDDSILAPEGLALHLQTQAKLASHPCSVLGVFEMPENYDRTPWGYLLRHSDLLFEYPNMQHHTFYGYTKYYTCNISTPRTLLVQAGMFDEDFTGDLWGAEDIEIGYRLEKLGAPVLFHKGCRAIHLHDLDLADFRRMFRVRGGGAVRIFAKHPEIGVHYATISDARIDFWNALPSSILEPLARLEQEVESMERDTWTAPSGPPPLLSQQRHLGEDLEYRRMWALAPRELRKLISSLHQGLVRERKRLREAKGTIAQAAEALYPVGLFLRWYYDTDGITSNEPWIRRLAAKERQWSRECIADTLRTRRTHSA